MAGPRQKTVLVVDDDQDLLSLVALVLEGEGFRVQTAVDGRAGLEAVEREMPDLILLDIRMPGMDGCEFTRHFRARHDYRTPIVVLTASMERDRWVTDTGAVGWIDKPFDLDTLVQIVRRYTRGQATPSR